jgi:hypothetical protein
MGAEENIEKGQEKVNLVVSLVDWVRGIIDWLKGLLGK